MNKKLVMMGAGVVAGSVLLMSSVYAGIGTTPGYDTYKSAIKNTASTVDNATQKINLSVEDNGKVLLQVNSTLKSGNDDQSSSANIALLSGQTEQSIQIFNQDDKAIIKTGNSEVYQVVEKSDEEKGSGDEGREHRKLEDPAFAQEMENVIDELVGNLKNKVTLKDNGTAKEIGLHLEGSQLPALVNTVGSLVIREGGREHSDKLQLDSGDTFGVNLQSIHDSLPKLTTDIRIQSVNLDADVNANNLITNHTAEIQIIGKDNEGTNHQVFI